MDAATIVGFILGLGCIAVALMQSEAGLRPFWDLQSLLITVGGSMGAVIISFSADQLKNIPKMIQIAFRSEEQDPLEIIDGMIDLAEKARREGLLALEDSLNRTDDAFLQRGIQLIVDGTDPELVRDILETDLAYIEDRHRSGKSIFDAMTAYAPAFGMIGTLIGLILMLRTLDKPSTIGPSMAIALITTLYGVIVANLVTGPIATNLAVKSAEEICLREMMLEGILSIQSGENPRIVEEKLMGFLAPKDRLRAEEQAEMRRAGMRTQREMADDVGGSGPTA
ncbi:MAG: motility protein A [Firmicutes bacterium]|jgi:chemotaxis protein MotA|nr:motility protein A [Bacillota bacterium]MDD4336675.1 motility protein A [Bacillota bacterium]MDD4792820.1 motility protein A [Bacillota bacterium]